MKKILFIIMLASLFACSKDDKGMSREEINEKKEQELVDNLVGKWRFSRAAEDKEFTKIVDLRLSENEKGYYIEFTRERTDITTIGFKFFSHYYEDYESGPIQIDEGAYVVRLDAKEPFIELRRAGIHYIHGRSKSGALDPFKCDGKTFSFIGLDSYSKSRYIEYKRIQ